jgi:simple sugar transport system permease protein
MLNYVAILAVEYLVLGPWSDPTPPFRFPTATDFRLGADQAYLTGSIHGGVALVLAFAGLLVLIDRVWSALGIRVVGFWRCASRGAVRRHLSTVYSNFGARGRGACAGLAGAIEVSASTTRLQAGLSPGYGFIAILVCWLANRRPFPIFCARSSMQAFSTAAFRCRFPAFRLRSGTILQAMLLLCVLAVVGLGRYRLRFARARRGPHE